MASADPVTFAPQTFRNRNYLVIINIQDEDDAQMIFETLNARGTPLLPSDLVKNSLFHRAQQEGADVDALYQTYWRPFEEEHHFWREVVGSGRMRRPRIDRFLLHYTTLMAGDEVPVGSLFQGFQQFAETNGEGAAWHLQTLREHAEIFRRFHTMSADTPEGLFFHRLEIMQTTTAFPFLLGLYRQIQDADDEADARLAVLVDIESFLMRRMVCRLSTRGYNLLFLDLAAHLRANGDSPQQAVRDFLLPQTADFRRWPDDREFHEAWLSQPLYRSLTRARMRMVLEALDRGLATGLNEDYTLSGQLTIEHMLPQEWQAHWPLPDVPGEERPEERLQRIERRNHLKHTVGNLTLVTRRLNPTMSNGPYEAKRDDILRHSAINLNRYFQDIDTWDEARIVRRSETLFEVARNIWPHPTAAAPGQDT